MAVLGGVRLLMGEVPLYGGHAGCETTLDREQEHDRGSSPVVHVRSGYRRASCYPPGPFPRQIHQVASHLHPRLKASTASSHAAWPESERAREREGERERLSSDDVSNGSNVIPRWARRGLAGLGPHRERERERERASERASERESDAGKQRRRAVRRHGRGKLFGSPPPRFGLRFGLPLLFITSPSIARVRSAPPARGPHPVCPPRSPTLVVKRQSRSMDADRLGHPARRSDFT